MPRAAKGQNAGVPRRFVGFYVPNGMHMPDWTPAGGGGAAWETPLLLQPLESHKQDLVVLTGLQNTLQADGLGDHAGGTGSFMTGHTVPKDVRVMPGPSIDQLLASHIGQDTKLPSIQLGGAGGNEAGTCDSGYPCSFTNQISFREDGSPMPKLDQPRDVFEQLFEGLDPTANAEEIARRNALRTSALDLVTEEANELMPLLSAHDRPKLDQYLTSVREVERRIELAGATSGQCVIPSEPIDGDRNGEGMNGYIETMLDLMALALHCDATRVISFQWGNAVSDRDYGFIGATGGHHNISHHQSQESNFDKLKLIDAWEMEKLNYFLDRLSELRDFDDTSVLSNTLLFLSSDVSDGNRHNHDDMPVLLAGQAGGLLETGRHLVYDDDPWFSNLFLWIAQAYGVPITEFGEHATQALPGLG
jgi:hypothetical protein